MNLDTADGRSRRRCPCADIALGHEHATLHAYTAVQPLCHSSNGRTTASVLVMT